MDCYKQALVLCQLLDAQNYAEAQCYISVIYTDF